MDDMEKEDKSEWLRGYVGGEIHDGRTTNRFGDVGDWDGDEAPICSADEFLDNSLPIAHSGISDHFKQRSVLRAGHNPGMRETMHEFKHGTLHSGSKNGPIVKSRKQAIAIGLSELRRGK